MYYLASNLNMIKLGSAKLSQDSLTYTSYVSATKILKNILIKKKEIE